MRLMHQWCELANVNLKCNQVLLDFASERSEDTEHHGNEFVPVRSRFWWRLKVKDRSAGSCFAAMGDHWELPAGGVLRPEPGR